MRGVNRKTLSAAEVGRGGRLHPKLVRCRPALKAASAPALAEGGRVRGLLVLDQELPNRMKLHTGNDRMFGHDISTLGIRAERDNSAELTTITEPKCKPTRTRRHSIAAECQQTGQKYAFWAMKKYQLTLFSLNELIAF